MKTMLLGRRWGVTKAETDSTDEDEADEAATEEEAMTEDEESEDDSSEDGGDDGVEGEDDNDNEETPAAARAAERARWAASLAGIDLSPAAATAVTALAETDAAPATVKKLAQGAAAGGGTLRTRMRGAPKAPAASGTGAREPGLADRMAAKFQKGGAK